MVRDSTSIGADTIIQSSVGLFQRTRAGSEAESTFMLMPWPRQRSLLTRRGLRSGITRQLLLDTIQILGRTWAEIAEAGMWYKTRADVAGFAIPKMLRIGVIGMLMKTTIKIDGHQTEKSPERAKKDRGMTINRRPIQAETGHRGGRRYQIPTTRVHLCPGFKIRLRVPERQLLQRSQELSFLALCFRGDAK
jgi:hypothetical protein